MWRFVTLEEGHGIKKSIRQHRQRAHELFILCFIVVIGFPVPDGGV